jgi:hypothetical protein
VKIRNVKHSGLRRLIEDGDPAGLPAAQVAKVEAIVAFLSAATGLPAVQRLQTWKAHRLTGDRKEHGACLSTATGASRSGSTQKTKCWTSISRITTEE